MLERHSSWYNDHLIKIGLFLPAIELLYFHSKIEIRTATRTA